MLWVKDQLHSIPLKQLKIVSSHYIIIWSYWRINININIYSPIGPDDVPQDFISIPTKNDVRFNWRSPIIPNGIITQYRLVVLVNVGTDLIRRITRLVDVTLNQKSISIIVDGFSIYQNHTATISDTTVVGYGPN